MNQAAKECVFYGVGSSYVGEVQETAVRLGWTVRAYVANQEMDAARTTLSPLVTPREIASEWLHLPVVLPLITPGFRKRLEQEARDLGFSSFASLIDPTAIVASSASIGVGALVNCAVMVGANGRLGQFALLNRGASVGHDGVLGDFVTVGPGAILCGGAKLDQGCFVGAGAIINPDIHVGANCVVASGTVVSEDVPERCLVAGNPGRIVKRRISGYRDTLV